MSSNCGLGWCDELGGGKCMVGPKSVFGPVGADLGRVDLELRGGRWRRVTCHCLGNCKWWFEGCAALHKEKKFRQI